MATVKLPFQNPHVTLVNEEIIEINYRGKKFKTTISAISKIYLSKRKTSYLSGLIGNLFVSRASGFKLYIHTTDNTPVTFDIATDEKFFFVSFISWIRNHITEANTVPPAKLNNKPPTAIGQAVAA